MLAIIVIALIVSSIWGMVFFRQCGLLGGCLAVLFVGSCLGHAFYHVSVGPIPVTADRVLLGILLVAYLVYRRWGDISERPLNQLDLLLLAFMAFLTFSTFTHDWRAHGSRGLASLLFFNWMPLTIYLIAREAPVRRRALLGMFGALALFGLYLAITSVLEQQQIWSLVFPRYIVSDVQAEFLGRGRGPFLNPVGNGIFLCAGLFSLLMFWPRTNRSGKAIILLLTVVYLAGIYCTLTRVVWLAALVCLPGMVMLNLPRRWSLVLVTAVGLLAATFVAAKWDKLNAFKRDRDVSVAEMSQSASLRPILAYLAWHVFLDRPLVGCGYRQYEAASDDYLGDHSTPLQLELGRRFVQHNVLLSLLAETGIIGVGLFILMAATLLQISWQLWSAQAVPLEVRQQGLLMLAMLISYTIMSMFHDIPLIPMSHMLMFFLAGITRNLQGELAGEATTRVRAPVPQMCEQHLPVLHEGV